MCVYVPGLYIIKLVALSIDHEHLTHIPVLVVNFNKESWVWGRLEIKREKSNGFYWKILKISHLFLGKKASLRRCIGIDLAWCPRVCVPFDFEKASIEIKKCFLLLINRMKGQTLESCFVHTLDHSITSRKEGGERDWALIKKDEQQKRTAVMWGSACGFTGAQPAPQN